MERIVYPRHTSLASWKGPASQVIVDCAAQTGSTLTCIWCLALGHDTERSNAKGEGESFPTTLTFQAAAYYTYMHLYYVHTYGIICTKDRVQNILQFCSSDTNQWKMVYSIKVKYVSVGTARSLTCRLRSGRRSRPRSRRGSRLRSRLFCGHDKGGNKQDVH